MIGTLQFRASHGHDTQQVPAVGLVWRGQGHGVDLALGILILHLQPWNRVHPLAPPARTATATAAAGRQRKATSPARHLPSS